MRFKARHLLRLFFFLFISPCIAFNPPQMAELSNGIKVEYRVSTPKEKAFPLLVILHGASFSGLNDVPLDWEQHWINKGYGLAQISMPGFSKSTGERDFCGPQTIASVSAVLDLLQKELNVTRMGIVAFGQGSVVTALMAAKREDVCCMVLANGSYNMLRHMDPEDTLFNLLRYYSFQINETEMKKRSPMEYVDQIKAPAYLMHRISNPIVRTDEVVQFSEALNKKGVECRICLLERSDEEDQKISYDEIIQETEKWVDKHMRA